MNAAQPVKFLIVGTGGYVVNLAVFALLHAAGIPYVAAAIASYLVSNALMYLGNRYVTFRLGHDGFWLAYARHVLVGGVVAGLNAAILALLVEQGGLDETLGLAISLLIVTPAAFLLNKRWTFRPRDLVFVTPVAAGGGGAGG
ncbi:MAG: GtrA family protein [Thermomicrobiales bacterium]|nr:GtrA family protein [Thermomicrobiales bacterium]